MRTPHSPYGHSNLIPPGLNGVLREGPEDSHGWDREPQAVGADGRAVLLWVKAETKSVLITGRDSRLMMVQITWQRVPEQALTEQAEVYILFGL